MSFNVAFGDSSTKGTTSTQGVQTSTGTQQGTTSNNQTQNTNSSTTGTSGTTGTQSSSGSSSTTSGTQTQGSESTQGQQNTTQTTTTKSLSDPVISGLTSLVTNLLGSGGGAGQGALNKTAATLGDFDPEAFVQQSMNSAKTQSDMDVRQAIGGVLDHIGGKNNSAVALLKGSIQNSANANLQGINANATKTAQEIQQGNTTAAANASNASTGFLSNLISSLKGAVTNVTGQAATNTGSTTSSQSGSNTTQNTNQSSTTNTAQNTDTSSNTVSSDQLQSLLSQLLNTSGTENTTAINKADTKKSSTGFSLGGS